VAEGTGRAKSAEAQAADHALPEPAKAVVEGAGAVPAKTAPNAAGTYAKAAAASNASPGRGVPAKTGPNAAGRGLVSNGSKQPPLNKPNPWGRGRGNHFRNAFGPQSKYIV